MPKPLSEERVQRILEMRKTGAGYRAIGAETGAGPGTIRKVLLANGYTAAQIIARKQTAVYTKKLLRKLWAMRNEGLSYAKIARRMNLSEKYMYERMKEFEDELLLEEYQQHQVRIAADDKRSPVCRTIERCCDFRCYLHVECPAYAAFINRKTESKQRRDG